MTIKEVIEKLESVKNKDLKLYVYDYEVGDNLDIDTISLFEEDQEHSEENMLSIVINNDK